MRSLESTAPPLPDGFAPGRTQGAGEQLIWAPAAPLVKQHNKTRKIANRVGVRTLIATFTERRYQRKRVRTSTAERFKRGPYYEAKVVSKPAAVKHQLTM